MSAPHCCDRLAERSSGVRTTYGRMRSAAARTSARPSIRRMLRARNTVIRRGGASCSGAVRRDFLKLWVGQSVSLLGSEVTLLAMPLLAVLVLGAVRRAGGRLSR